MPTCRLAWALLLCLPWTTWAGEEATQATAEGSRRTISLAANLFLPSVGVEVAWQPLDRLALALQVTTLVVHFDASLRARLSLRPGRRGGPYLGASGHLWYSPLVLSAAAPAVAGEAGWEWQTRAGGLIGLGVGAALVRVPPGSQGSGPDARWQGVPVVDLRIGLPW